MKIGKFRMPLLLVGLCIILITVASCAKVSSSDEGSNLETTKKESVVPSENQFDAKILAVTEDYIMVEALEGQNISGEVRVNTGLLKSEDVVSLEKDEIVRITHDGKMTMSIPPQMTAIEIYQLTNNQIISEK